MRAAIMRDGKIALDDMAIPEPGEGEVLVKTLACGICGSDLHTLKHGPEFVKQSQETGGSFDMDLSRDVVMGHEFCAEILDYGPGTTRILTPGTRVVSVPMTFRGGKMQTVGYSNSAPGGYAENMVLFEPMLLPVPNGLSTEHATLTEPVAVGFHAVQKSGIQHGEVPLVIGCGPVGLAVIMALKMQGIGPIVASDFSPRRRKLAEQLGADIVVNPADTSPYECWRDLATIDTAGADIRGNHLTGSQAFKNGVYFECVGVPGIISQMMAGAGRDCRIVIVGVCMEQDVIHPLAGINKELNLQFVIGYTPEEFADSLNNIAEGKIDVASLITGTIPIDGIPKAFTDLADPEQHAKILVVH
ncbi:MAG: threonine dehydrogenase-like Zn-dependent dehydrogenase [Gammaproteobacteria bacterium]|jgi:threonine dehydrogenase-like Zn-dependent dehydrogenase